MIVRTIMGGKKKRTGPLFKLRLADLLTHYSGLPKGLPILPFLQYRSEEVGRYDKYFHPKQDEKFNVLVAGEFYLRNDYRDSLWEAARHINPYNKPFYEYSDLNMILVQQAIDSINREPIDLYLNRSL